MRSLIPILTIISFSLCKVYGVPPVLNYAGQVAVNGEAFEGNGLFKFALVSDNGTSSYWSNDGTSVDGSEPQASISVTVNGGLYSVLLGNTAIEGMGAIDPHIFAQHSDAKLRVWFSDGINGFQQLSPDRPFASVPYAFSAGNAETAGSAPIANGAVTKSMLSSEVINDLNRKITMNDLDPAVIADLNDSVTDGSIGLSKLSPEVSNALKPVVVGQPSSVVGVGGTTAYLSVDATGGDNSYQWRKNGVDIVEATSHTLSITDLNASQHEGNYTVVVSNAFGSTTSSVAQIDVNGSLTDGLVGWWKFDETEGTVASDSSGNGNDGNLTNGPTWTEGKIGGALSFDGVDDHVNLGNVLSSSYTKGAWVKKTDTSIGNILSFDDSHALWIKSTGYLAVKHFYSGSFELEDDKLFSINQWMHVCSTYEANTQEMSLLKNGSVIMSTSNVKELGSNIRVFAGKFKNGNSWTGLLDDVRIYDRALSAFEVKALYELGEQPVQESGSGTTTVVNGTVADGSITTNQLSEQILKYLKPEITQQPTVGNIFADTDYTFSISAEGKYLTYQWKKNGVNLADETNATLTITDANATLHDGNYSVVVSNDFGSVESEELEVAIADFSLFSYSGLMLWLDASNLMTADPIWIDKSGNGNHASKHNTPTVQTNAQNGLSLMRYEKVLPASDTDYHEWNDISDIRTLFAVFKRDNGNDGAVLTDDNFYHFYSDGSPMLSSTFASHNVKNGLYRLNGTAITAISTNYPVSLSIVAIRTLGNVEASRIGRDRSVDYGHFDGDFAELIIFNTPLSDDYISEVEGYLAHKWGLTALLPSNHTYKNSVP